MRQAFPFVVVLLLASCAGERGHAPPPGTPEAKPIEKHEPVAESKPVTPVPTPEPQKPNLTGNKVLDEAFAWFDSLGYPSLEGRPFVRAATGGWHQNGNDPKRKDFIWGFLLTDNGTIFQVLTTELVTWTLELRRTEEEDELNSVYFRPENLKEYATGIVAAYKSVDAETRWLSRFGEKLRQRTEFFVLARACVAAGLNEAALGLYDYAQQELCKGERGKPDIPLRDCVEEDLALHDIWRATLMFESADIPRKSMLEAFERIAMLFPKSEYFKSASETAELLRSMVKEDDEHAAKKLPPLSEMTVSERVAELIFQLRDQNGHQYSQPGECDIFDEWFHDEPGKTPAHQLVAIGYPAIPQLIEVLEDNRLTRCVGFWRNFCFSHYVLRVGDCAQEIISRIAHRSFYERRSTSGAMVKDGQAAACKRAVQEWWAEFSEKGEEKMLVESVVGGGDDAPWQAERLVEAYPKSALAAIKRGVQAANKSYIRAKLIESAAKLPPEETRDFFRQQLKYGEDLNARLRAAQALYTTEPDVALDAMIAEWRACNFTGEHFEMMVRFLLRTKSAKVVHAIADGFAKRDVLQRYEVVDELCDTFFAFEEATPGTMNQQGEFSTAAEELLVACLLDTEPRRGISMSRGPFGARDPRICDYAAFALSLLWPNVYTWKQAESHLTATYQCLKLANLYRARKGLDLLPLPGPVKIEAAPAEELEPLYADFISSDETKQAAGKAALLEKGLTALSFISAKLERLEKPDRRLSELERDLSCIVREIEWDKNGGKSDEAFTMEVNKLRGRPLTYEGLRGLFLHIANHMPNGATGLLLEAERENDGTGVVLRLKLATEVIQSTNTNCWSTQVGIYADGGYLKSYAGTCADDWGTSGKTHDDWKEAAEQALNVGTYRHFIFELSLVREGGK
ncbi:MAG: hypothetical protein IT461_17130 [Planctomycetes bacterium]|nr:hypothetical protein [Planctomycetota bacterium]